MVVEVISNQLRSLQGWKRVVMQNRVKFMITPVEQKKDAFSQK